MSTTIHVEMNGETQEVVFDFDQCVVQAGEVFVAIGHTFDPDKFCYCDATDDCTVHNESFLCAGSTLMIYPVGACSTVR